MLRKFKLPHFTNIRKKPGNLTFEYLKNYVYVSWRSIILIEEVELKLLKIKTINIIYGYAILD
jgi:hypothetical protein